MVCFRGNVHDTLTGTILPIIEEHLLHSFPLLMRNAVSPWTLYHYLLRTHLEWWNVWADLDRDAWDTDIGRAELYARQARKLDRGSCPLTRRAQDLWCRRFHAAANNIPPMLKEQMLIIVQWCPEQAQCNGPLSPNCDAFTQHVNAKAGTCDSEDDDEDFFTSIPFHNMCKALAIQ